MTEPQINEVCELMKQTIAEELGLRCGHRIKGKKVYSQPGYQDPGKHDFFVDFPCSANVKARLFIKDNTSYACVYGNGFRGEGGTRAKISAREREVAGLGIEKFKVSSSNPKLKSPEKDMAVWCGFHHGGGENWYANRQQVIATIKDFLKWLRKIVACPEHKQPISKEGVAMLPSNTENKWEGWDEYRAYWDNFVKEWFTCKESAHNPMSLPDDSLTKALDSYFAEDLDPIRGCDDAKLSRNELPEPYMGNPQGAKFVIVQMNPGMSELGEETKYYSNLNSTNGFLIRDFAECCEKKYSNWIDRWSLFKAEYPNVPKYPNGVPPSKVCGHDWWWHPNRRQWIKCFAECDLSEVFVIESCPYHSRKFDSAMAMRKDYLLQRVILPAAKACRENDLNCVVCLGSKMKDFLENVLKARLVMQWNGGIFEKEKEDGGWYTNCVTGQKEEILEWPPCENGKAISRWYQLYEVPIGGGEVCRFLSMYANCMRFPGENFRKVEERIKRDLARG